MTHETLVCQENTSADTLSALRDQALPEGEAARLRAHISTCAACQARLADFDHVAAALRAQRELDPGDRILAGVQARIAGQTGGAAPRGGRANWNTWDVRSMTGRRLWAGLAGLASVAAIILLFVYVFASIGQHLQTAATPTIEAPTPTATWFKKIEPTQTPALVQVPPFTQAVPAIQAWGAMTPARRFTITSTGNYAFQPQLYSSDFRTVGGILVNDTTGFGMGNPPLALYNTATRSITRLGPTGGMVMMDDRYIVYDYDITPGATCGPCHQTLWSLDRGTGKTWEFDPGPKKPGSQEVLYSGVQSVLTSADHVAFLPMEGQIWVADLATHSVKLVVPIGAQPASATTNVPFVRIMDFQWPYLIYDEAPIATPDAQGDLPSDTLNILNLTTGVNTHISAQLPDQNPHPAYMSVEPGSLWLVGNSLYAATGTQITGIDSGGQPVNVTYGELYVLENAFAPGGQFAFRARWQYGGNGQDSGGQPNARVMPLGSGYYWDFAEHRLVYWTVPTEYTDGPYLIGVSPAQSQSADGNNIVRTFHVTVYDTSTFAAP